jgi:uncharacterized membrane protein
MFLLSVKHDKDILDAMTRNLKNWKGSVYFNPQDSRLWVPKRYPSLGWTLNFANLYAYVIIAVIIVIIIGTYLFHKG